MTKKEQLPVWDLTPLYASPQDPHLIRDMDHISKAYDKFEKKYSGKVSNLSSEQMEVLLTEMDKLSDQVGVIGSYAGLATTVDTVDPVLGALEQKVMEWGTELGKKVLFFSIEWKDLSPNKAQKIVSGLSHPLYKHYLLHLREYAPYTLTKEAEEIILEKDVTGANSWARLFTQITSTLTYTVGKKELSQSQVLALVSDPERTKRKAAAAAVTKTLKSRKMELTHIYNTLMADKMIEDKRRGYKTWITGRNISNKVSDEIVQNLITAVTSRYDIVAKHYEVKKKLLKLPELFEYDRYAPITLGVKPESISWDHTVKTVSEAYHGFSPEIGMIVDDFFKNRYVHAALTPNKRGGAFCASAVASKHPYILMNYVGKIEDVMTLSHELGHGIHQYLAGKSQGNYGLGMPLTTQELASTFGEMIVFSKIKNSLPDKKTRLILLTQKIDSIIATVFRQVAMHSFEERVHTTRRTKGELSTDDFSHAWIESQRAMFGKSVTLTDEYAIWWSYIPHFIHTPGYVYAYAFGELLALSLYGLYMKNPTEFIPKYLSLLKAGDSDYPLQLLQKAGIDISQPDIWNTGLMHIESLIAEEISLAESL